MSSCSYAYGATEDGLMDWCTALTLVARLVAYVAALALIVLIIFTFMRYLDEFEESRAMWWERPEEIVPILPPKATTLTYGTCEPDLEAGNCSNASASSGGVCSSEELYDCKICIICYDEPRNCFFVPCGHCATCYTCADRIVSREGRVCPVCRRLIGKVRKMFSA